MKEKIEILSLGGLDERGKNLSIIDINNEWFIIDTGYKIPNNVAIGVRHIIPNTNYLIKNLNKIRGIFLSTSNYNEIAALVFMIDKIKNVPIYCGEITKIIVQSIFKRHNKKFDKFIIIKEKVDII